MKNLCAWENCLEIGEYRAPTEKDNSKKYKLLCLVHIKEFNKNWNYFSDMTESEIFDFFKILWNNALKDDLKSASFINKQNNLEKFKFNNNDIKAFSVLGISVGLKWNKVQEKFKKLVKKFHPDMNAGNKKYEDKLKVITLAYTQLKNTYRTKIDT